MDSFSAEELEKKCKTFITIQTNDIQKTVTVLEKQLQIKDYKVVQNDEIHLFERLEELETISKTITDSGLIITKFVTEGESLEEYYLSKVTVCEETEKRRGLFIAKNTKKADKGGRRA